ncbi:MAG: hypothetical protein AAF085_15930, partial [Planctomycetota bacterium]
EARACCDGRSVADWITPLLHCDCSSANEGVVVIQSCPGTHRLYEDDDALESDVSTGFLGVVKVFLDLDPLIIVAILYGLTNSVRYAWSSRGVEPDGMYCAKCRFDVRGATSESCPECGAYLLHGPDQLDPRGGILVKDLDPPMSQGMRMLVYLLTGFAPSVAAVVFFGMLLPFNYLHELRVELALPNQTYSYSEVDLWVESKRSWIGAKQFDDLYSWQADASALRQFNNANPRGLDDAKAFWDSIMAEQSFDLSTEEQSVLRDEFAAVLLAVCEFNESKARGELKQLQMDWYGYSEPSFHGLYVLFCFVAVIAALIAIGVRARQDHEAIHAEFSQKVERVQSRYRAMLADEHKPG